MNKLKPLVTICTLVHYTHPEFVISAIESIYNQTYQNIEHIIVNDAPDDKQYWPQIKKYLIDNNLPSRIIEHEVNFGVCKTLNQIIEISDGKYFCGCSDDILLPNKIETEVSVFESIDEEYALCYSDTEFIDSKGEKLNISFIKNNLDLNYLPEGNIFELLLDRVFIPAISVLYKKSALLEIGGFDQSIGFEDLDIFLRLSKKYKIKYIDIPLTEYRQHDFSLSKKYEKWDSDLIKIYKKHVDNDRVNLNFKLLNNHLEDQDRRFNYISNFLIFIQSKLILLKGLISHGYNFKKKESELFKGQLYEINGSRVFIFENKSNWYDAQKIIKDFGDEWYAPSIKQLESINWSSMVIDHIWSKTPGYGLYAWYHNSSYSKSNYCLRDKLFNVVAFYKSN